MTLRKLSLAMLFLTVAAVAPALAQGPIQERINFTVSGPFELKGTNMVLAGGNYVLFQIDPRDRQLFALYEGDMTHSPIAMIRTARVYYKPGRLPGKTMMLMETNEASSQNYEVLEGWNVPGDYGWEVISVTPRRGAINSRIQARR
jgi:hypothetical protein